MNRGLHLRVYGLVQGVSFRFATVEQVRPSRLSGWVRNCDDGSVEILAEGEEVQLQALLEWAHRGPWGARVDRVQADWKDATGKLEGFEVRR